MAQNILLIILFINILFIFAMIFIERKKPQVIISWLMIMVFAPVLGFSFYLLIGSGLSVSTRMLVKNRRAFSEQIKLYHKKNISTDDLEKINKDAESIAQFNKRSYGSQIFLNNNVTIYNDGLSKIDSLKQSLTSAKSSINMEYYIFADDKIGCDIMDILCKKAMEGVKVKLIYDSVGCLRAPRRFFKRLKRAGGEVAEFFPPFMGIRVINFKVNYRNHKKLAIIDGKTAFIGGINIREDHMGRSKKLSPWRDTHCKIEGESVAGFQSHFFVDWRFCKKITSPPNDLFKSEYFPAQEKKGTAFVQSIASGPDEKTQQIKDTMIKMMQTAKKSIVLQTPYLIPDESFMTALKMAHMSGVDVNVFIPDRPDKKIVYAATLSYAKDLTEIGIKVWLYKGFMHSKVLMIDDTAITIGSCNADNRSFELNFELNAVIYCKKTCDDFAKMVEKDKIHSLLATNYLFRHKPLLTKLAQALFRLFSPLL
ncbi:MAG: cardiolipin synthase [Clostridia bacterium]